VLNFFGAEKIMGMWSSPPFFKICILGLVCIITNPIVDLATYPFAQTVQNSHSADAILDLLQDKAEEFRTYRDGNRKLINCLLKPIVQVLYAVSGFLAQASASVSPPINYYLILF
jgi:hypothetical protein